MIELKHLCKTYAAPDKEIHALEDINLTIRDGEIFGIIGLSGAGKSTLVRCINLLEIPTSGQVLVDGKDLTQLPRKELLLLRRSIGMIFQSFNLLEQRSVLRNVCFPLEISGVERKSAEKKARELLQIVGLADRADSYPSQLSGGQKQRIAMARTLLMECPIVVFDDSMSAVDMETDAQIREALRES
ncbi:MAG: ATP-binding cassette domain-containing protein, partial [Oscillospiraceae bacterium]|nr:ATP-binding cassette domain-containing protein [Oscillospiraceae bacterium]